MAEVAQGRNLSIYGEERRMTETIIPQALFNRNRWLIWTRRPRAGKFTKAPVNPYTGRLASITDPRQWSGFDQAQRAKERFRCDGLGFVLNGDGIIAIDLDDCVSWNQGRFQINEQAERIVRSLDSYTEFSPSRKGIHVWLFGSVPEESRRNDPARIEIYANRQYVTITGNRVPGSPDVIENRSKEVFALYRRFFPDDSQNPHNSRPGCPVERRSTVRPGYGYSPIVDDDAVLLAARSAKNGARFSALFDEEGPAGYASTSEADQALCNLLAFWTARNPDQMERLFLQSGRHRNKWKRQDYVARTIGRALDRVTDVWRPRQCGRK
jgi:primase-polymerase (primpol)-like protein